MKLFVWVALLVMLFFPVLGSAQEQSPHQPELSGGHFFRNGDRICYAVFEELGTLTWCAWQGKIAIFSICIDPENPEDYSIDYFCGI